MPHQACLLGRKSATLIRTLIPSVSLTNYTASHSRMTNGTVQKQGTSVVVQYQNGAQTISVPSNVEVTQIVPKKETLAVGDTVYLAIDKQPDGSLTTNVYENGSPFGFLWAPTGRPPLAASLRRVPGSVILTTRLIRHSSAVAPVSKRLDCHSRRLR
jgi:hypothetical protein